MTPLAGEAFRVDLGSGRKGREQRGPRYVIVIQHDDFPLLSTRLCVPTSRSAQESEFHVPVEVAGERTLALATQTLALDVETRLQAESSAGHIDTDSLVRVRKAVVMLVRGAV